MSEHPGRGRGIPFRPGGRSNGRPRRRRLDRWRLVSPTGAKIVSLRQLSNKERLRVTAPSIFTTINMFSGLSSVLLAFRGHYLLAASLIGLSIVMDIADGAVARAIGAMSPFGLQLDSLADLIAFGLAPAVLVHTWALPQWPVLAWAGACFWLACAAFRLARFNVTVDPLADKRYFVGLPSPGAALVVMATILWLQQPRPGWWMVVPIVVSVVPALLMVTTVRFRSFRNLLAPRSPRAWVGTVLAIAAIIVGLLVVPGWTAVAVAYGYVLSAPLGMLSAPLRERWWGAESVVPPRHRLQSVFLPIVDDAEDPEEEPEDREDCVDGSDHDEDVDGGPG